MDSPAPHVSARAALDRLDPLKNAAVLRDFCAGRTPPPFEPADHVTAVRALCVTGSEHPSNHRALMEFVSSDTGRGLLERLRLQVQWEHFSTFGDNSPTRLPPAMEQARGAGGADLTVMILLGYMRIIPGEFLDQMHRKAPGLTPCQIMNLHPDSSLYYKGTKKQVLKRVIADGYPYAGSCIHIVNAAVDTGEILSWFAGDPPPETRAAADPLAALDAWHKAQENLWSPWMVVSALGRLARAYREGDRRFIAGLE
ncbi:MAG: Phosphoribosylglycinamide formyltransferase [Myxococcota bacterium]|nr:Phosphoribosylglycinamide formyltransferase [Myxococcota bacterium]